MKEIVDLLSEADLISISFVKTLGTRKSSSCVSSNVLLKGSPEIKGTNVPEKN